jgi:hypothetical protein
LSGVYSRRGGNDADQLVHSLDGPRNGSDEALRSHSKEGGVVVSLAAALGTVIAMVIFGFHHFIGMIAAVSPPPLFRSARHASEGSLAAGSVAWIMVVFGFVVRYELYVSAVTA